jgi:hypothetical protein
MRLLHYGLMIGILMAASARMGRAQAPGSAPEDPPVASPPPTVGDLEEGLREIEGLRRQQAALQAKPQDDEQKKKIALLQKEVETLEEMVKLLAKQLKKQPPAGAAVEKLEGQAATLEARALQAARRDVELANAIDDLREQADARERYGCPLPAPLKELFLPSQTNETPLSIYGALAFGYSQILGNPTTAANGAGRPRTPGGFYFGEFTPDFLLKLNDWIFLEAEIAITPTGSVTAGAFAQADFFVNDWLTIIAGRFVAPIGWYNERINNPWVNKLPADAPGSAPLPWLQVLPPFSLLGVQATGSFYLGSSPIKLEYAAYVSNGLNVAPMVAGSPTIDELANLENMQNTFNVRTDKKAVGGRLGFWWPQVGLEAGFSAMYNSDYLVGGFSDNISLWVVDLNYRKGNWDVRAEYGATYQQAQPFLANNITRQGFFGQIAYRPYDSPHWLIRNLEAVYRYSFVNFQGIDRTALTLSAYATPVDVPVKRQQHEMGINYYFSPRMLVKCAYQINDEPGFHLHDNQFITELAWGW